MLELFRTSRSLLKYEVASSFIIAKGSNKIIATTTCKNKRERKHFTQDFTRKEVELLIKHNIIKGDNNIRTFNIIYLKAKFIIRENDDMESVLDNIPSSENILKLSFNVLVISFVSVTNEISLPKISFPR